jgi:hypothetical protein
VSRVRRHVPLALLLAGVAASIVACTGRGSGTGQPYYGPGTGPVASFTPVFGGGGGSGAGNQTEFVYAVNGLSNELTIYQVDEASGCLANINSGSLTCGPSAASNPTGQAFTIVAYPDHTIRYMFVGVSGGVNEIEVFQIDKPTKGNLLLSSQIDVSQQGTFSDMAFRSDGTVLYVLTNDPAHVTGPTIASYGVDPTTGIVTAIAGGAGTGLTTSLLLIQSNKTAVLGNSLTVDPDDQFVYVTMSNSQVAVVGIDNKGGLNAVGNPPATPFLASGALSPSCGAATFNTLFTGSISNSNLKLFTTNAMGTITAVANSVPVVGQSWSMLAPIQAPVLYVANGAANAGTVQFFSLGSGGTVLPLNPASIGGTVTAGMPPAPPTAGPSVSLRCLAVNSTNALGYSLDCGLPMPPTPQQVSCYTIAGGIWSVANPPAAPINGMTFNNPQVQPSNSPGLTTVLLPRAILCWY